MTLNNRYPQFQGYAVFDAEYLRNGTTCRHRFKEILIVTNTCPTVLNSVISNDLDSLSKIFNDTTLNKQAELALAASASHEYSQAIQLRCDWL